MLSVFGLVIAGFLLGVLLAGSFACFVIGIIHREAVSIVDNHMFAMAGTVALRSEFEGSDATQLGSIHANH